MSEHRFRLKRGDFEFEVSGEQAFVAQQATRILGQLGDAFWQFDTSATTPSAPAAAPAPAPVVVPEALFSAPEPVAVAAAPELPAHLSEAAIPRVSASFRPKVNISLTDLVEMKEAVEPVDVVVVTAYYMEKYLQRDAYSREELGAQLGQLEAAECWDIEPVLELAVMRGFLDAVRDQRYTLTYKGQTYVRDGLVS